MKISRIPVRNPPEVSLVNGIFVDKSLKLNTTFQKEVTNILHSTISTSDFVGNPAYARTEINNWVYINTMGKTEEILSKSSVTAATNLVLVNALYFRAQWNQGFPKTGTDTDPFYNLNGNVSQVVMLDARRAVPYAEDDTLDAQYIELPYKGDFFMGIILPRQRDGIRNCEHQFNTQTLRDIRAKVPMLKAANQRLVDIKIPKFKVEGTFDLAGLLAKAGVTWALGKDADFSTMVSGGRPILSTSTHKASIEIDEWGTLATGDSAVEEAPIMKDWVPDYAPTVFTADHPFLFFIQHRPSESVLFAGRVDGLS